MLPDDRMTGALVFRKIFTGPDCGLCSVLHARFLKNGPHMHLDGGVGDAQRIRNFLVGKTVQQSGQYRDLTL